MTFSSVIELRDTGDTAFNPVSFSCTPLHGQLNHCDEVGRMARSGQSTEPLESLVDWASVRVLLHNVNLLVWLHPDVRHLGEESLGDRLFKCALFVIPSTTLNKETINVGAVGSLLCLVKFLFVLHLVVPIDLIDGDCVLSGKVLLQTREERLCEEESRDPEIAWFAFFDPLANEAQSFNKVDNVRCKGLQRWVRSLGPWGWDSVIEERVTNLFKLAAHHNLTLDGELDVLQ